MAKRGGFDFKGSWPGMQMVQLAVLGAGAAPPTIPLSGTVPPLFPGKANNVSRLVAEAPTRSGAGVYTVTLMEDWKMVAWLNVMVSVFGTAGASGQVSAYSPATRIMTLRTFVGGAATDLASGTDLAVITILGVDSSTVL